MTWFPFDIVVGVRQLPVHHGTDEEVWNNVVAFCYVVAQFVVFLFFIVTVVKQVDVPLNDVAGIGELLINRFHTYWCALFVVVVVCSENNTNRVVSNF